MHSTCTHIIVITCLLSLSICIYIKSSIILPAILQSPKAVEHCTNKIMEYISHWDFISQTAADANGKYTITWKDQDGNTVLTEHNLFNC